MSNPVIYYIGKEDDEGISAKALKKDLESKSSYKDILCSAFPKKLSFFPEEVILLAHSDDSLKTIGEQTPVKLADSFAKLYNNNKDKLTSIKLVACEAGHGENPLAYQLVKELAKRGFSNVAVHAATHPRESIGGVVSVITDDKGQKFSNSMRNGQVSAVMYGNVATKEHIRYYDLLKKGRNNLTEEKKEFNKLKKPSLNFQKTVITLVREIGELDEPRNTYKANEPCPSLSLDAAVRLDYLRTQYRIAGDNKSKITSQLKSYIDFTEQNPNLCQTDKKISAFLTSNKIDNEIEKAICHRLKEAQENIPSIPQKIKSQSVAFQESETPTPADSNSADEDYLDKLESDTTTPADSKSFDEHYLDKLLLKEGGLLNRIFYWLDLTETRIFTKYLSQQLHIIKKEELQLKSQFDELKLVNLKRDTSETSHVPNGGRSFWNPFWGKSSSTVAPEPSQIAQPHQPIPFSLEAIDDQLQNTTLSQSTIATLETIQTQLKNMETKKNNIKTQINEFIDNYIRDKENSNDEMHVEKIKVMKAIKTYVNDPIQDNWMALTALTTENKQWKKGFFSKVNATMKQVEVFHEEIEKQEPASPQLH